MLKKVLASILLPIAVIAVGFVTGILPGLLLGLLGWHEGAAIVIPIIWAIGYVKQRARNYGDVNLITLCVAVFGGVGVGFSIYLFGNMTS